MGRMRWGRRSDPGGEEHEVSGLAEKAPIEQKAGGKVSVQREELALTAVTVVTLAVVRREVRGMGIVGRLRSPQGESSGGVGAVHDEARGMRGDRRRF